MKRCTYQIAVHKGHKSNTREGYLKPVEATCGTVVNFALVKLFGEWFGDHAATGYAISALRAPSRKKLVEIIDGLSPGIADKAIEKARFVPILNPEFASEAPND